MKNIFILILFLMLNNCGYSPVYQTKNNESFKIVVNEISGDSSIKNILNKKLKGYGQKESEKIFVLSAFASFSKTILSKDKTGRFEDLNLSTKIDFVVKYNDRNYKLSFDENLNIKRLPNFSEQNNYENEVRENFVDTIVKELIFNLNRLK